MGALQAAEEKHTRYVNMMLVKCLNITHLPLTQTHIQYMFNHVKTILYCVCVCVLHTQQVLDQLWVGHQWFRVSIDTVSAVLDLSQCFKVAQQYITQPLSIHTWDLPLLGLLILEPAGSRWKAARQHISNTV